MGARVKAMIKTLREGRGREGRGREGRGRGDGGERKGGGVGCNLRGGGQQVEHNVSRFGLAVRR